MTARPTTPPHPDCSPGSHWQERLVLPGVELYLGDCAEILPLLTFGAVVTDPPYGVGFVSGMNKVKGAIMGDETPPDVRWMANYPAVVWGGNNFCDQLPRSAGWLLWDKTHAESCRHSQAEIAWSNVVNTVRWHREAYHGFMRQRDGWFHPTQKPPGLMAWCLQWIDPELTVIDPYMGSGTTGIACVRQGRKFIGVERDPEHFNTAVERIRQEMAQGDLFHGQNVQGMAAGSAVPPLKSD
jgi:DNA modification methylase